MTRLFLNQSARESLLKTGRATVRKGARRSKVDGAWLCHVAIFGKCWIPEPWCPAAGDDGMTQWSEDGNTYKVHYAFDPREHDVIALDDDGFRKWNADGTEASPWMSAATMPQWAARLHVRVASVRVVKDGDWWWEIEMERITP